MVRVIKNYQAIPPGLSNSAVKGALIRALSSQSGSIFQNRHYAPEDVREALNTIYHNKCAYCESEVAHVAVIQVEHYRPKARVADRQTGFSGNGYYWLAVEWSNLLLACPNCNGKSAKGNQFPVIGTRVNTPPFDSQGLLILAQCQADHPDLLAESPFLLNPEIDDPAEHLTFDNHGRIVALSPRGQRTIEICQLDRDALYVQRKKRIDEIVKSLRELLWVYDNTTSNLSDRAFMQLLTNIFGKIFTFQQPDQPYALLGRRMNEQFETIVLSHLPEKYRNHLRLQFEIFTANQA